MVPGLLLVLQFLVFEGTTGFPSPRPPTKHTTKNTVPRTTSRLALLSSDDGIAPSEVHVPSIDRRGMLRASAAAVFAILGPSTSPSALADDDVEAKSALVKAANTFVRDGEGVANPLDAIDWNKPKRRGLNTEQMADAINDGLVENEWFVTGRGKPEYFSDRFAFMDPQVSLNGFEEYCRGVRRLFGQGTARCELVCCSVTARNTITVLWRNSGIVNIGSAKINLKPYLVTTTLQTDPEDGNLVVSQVDEFDSDPFGLVLYQVPLLRPLAGRPAPPVDVLKQNCDFRTCKMRK